MNVKAQIIHTKPTHKVGFVLKPHGYNGQITIQTSEIVDDDFLLIDYNNKWVPFKILSKHQNIVKLKDVDTFEMASEISGKDILTFSDNSESKENTDWLVGYSFIDNCNKKTGSIIQIIELPGHLNALVSVGEKTCQIPIHNDFIIEKNSDAKTLLLNLPSGIFDL